MIALVSSIAAYAIAVCGACVLGFIMGESGCKPLTAKSSDRLDMLAIYTVGFFCLGVMVQVTL